MSNLDAVTALSFKDLMPKKKAVGLEERGQPELGILEARLNKNDVKIKDLADVYGVFGFKPVNDRGQGDGILWLQGNEGKVSFSRGVYVEGAETPLETFSLTKAYDGPELMALGAKFYYAGLNESGLLGRKVTDEKQRDGVTVFLESSAVMRRAMELANRYENEVLVPEMRREAVQAVVDGMEDGTYDSNHGGVDNVKAVMAVLEDPTLVELAGDKKDIMLSNLRNGVWSFSSSVDFGTNDPTISVQVEELKDRLTGIGYDLSILLESIRERFDEFIGLETKDTI